ncbi:hypothetical protein HGRIS_013125 [Hohenbuehelia grisea]|uniref:Uncharacterized protein n=1 Tax=Hohenbuehelia grisea TaxID=104357 RepID=A0ABR3IUI6_9AGAR
MQTLLQRTCRPATRCLSTTPWFVDPNPLPLSSRPLPPHLTSLPTPSVPENVPQPIKELHAQLAASPHLDRSTLIVTQPPSREPGPPLPLQSPRGRRRRGGTYPGHSAYDIPGGIWDWVVMAQVKEGTENKGGIESVVRVVRKTLLGMSPPLALPPNSKKRMHNGWAMVDAGSFAVHVLSKEAREKYFGEGANEW